MALFNSSITEGLAFGDKVREAAEGPMSSFMQGAKLGIEKGNLDVNRGMLDVSRVNANVAKTNAETAAQKAPSEIAKNYAQALKDEIETEKARVEKQDKMFRLFAMTGDITSMNKVAAYNDNVVVPKVNPQTGQPSYEIQRAATGEVITRIDPNEEMTKVLVQEAGADRRHKQTDAEDQAFKRADGTVRSAKYIGKGDNRRAFFIGPDGKPNKADPVTASDVPYDAQTIINQDAKEEISFTGERLKEQAAIYAQAEDMEYKLEAFQQLADQSNLYGPGGTFVSWVQNLAGGLGMDVGTGPMSREAATGIANQIVGAKLKGTFGGSPSEGERKFLISAMTSMDSSPFARKLLSDYLLLDAKLGKQKYMDMVNYVSDNGFKLITGGKEPFDKQWAATQRKIRDGFATQAMKLVKAEPKNMVEKDLLNALIKRPGSRDDILKGWKAAGHELPEWAQ